MPRLAWLSASFSPSACRGVSYLFSRRRHLYAVALAKVDGDVLFVILNEVKNLNQTLINIEDPPVAESMEIPLPFPLLSLILFLRNKNKEGDKSVSRYEIRKCFSGDI